MALRGRSLTRSSRRSRIYGLGRLVRSLRPHCDKQGWALFISLQKELRAGSTIYGASPVKTTMTGKDGRTPQSRRKRPTREWRLHVHNLTHEHSARSLRRAETCRTDYPNSDENISKKADIPQAPLDRLDFNVDNMCRLRRPRRRPPLDELIMVNATTWDVADEINHRFGWTPQRRLPRPHRRAHQPPAWV